MVKFKLRIFRSFLTKDTFTPPEKPPPPSQLTAVDLTCTTSPPPPPPHRSSFKTTFLCSVFRCCGASSGDQYASEDLQSQLPDDDYPRPKICNSTTSTIAGFQKKKNRRVRKGHFLTIPHGTREISGSAMTSSPDSDQFTTKYTINDEDEQVQQQQQQPETSRSFSTNNSSKPYKLVKKNRQNDDGGGGGISISPEWGSPARLSVFKKLMPCKVEGKVKESFAVVKRSENPYEDFKKSMMEMIVEKEMVEESDLRQLLQCFLSLNSRYHHGVIMEAFSEIWDTMFLHQYRTFGI